jgi:hypothetical protein
MANIARPIKPRASHRNCTCANTSAISAPSARMMPAIIVAEALIEAGQVQFMIEQMIQRMLEGTEQPLFGKNNGKKLRTSIDSLVAGHLDIGSREISICRSCSSYITGAISLHASCTPSLAIASISCFNQRRRIYASAIQDIFGSDHTLSMWRGTS